MARIAAGGGPMKMMPGVGAGLGELGVLGKEAVARMDGRRAAPLARPR